MTTQPVLTVRDPRTALTIIPGLLGFIPSESVVLTFLTRSTRAVLVSVRMDLDGAMDSQEWIADAVEAIYRHNGGASIDVVSTVVSDRPPRDVELPWIGLLRFADIHVVDSLWVDTTIAKAGSYLCQQECCPFDFAFDTVGLDPEHTVAPSRESIQAQMAYVGDLAIAKPLSPRNASARWFHAVMQGEVSDYDVSCLLSTLAHEPEAGEHGYDRRDLTVAYILADATRGGMLPTWLIARLAQHTRDASTLACLAALAYCDGDGATTRILLDLSEHEGGASLGALVLATLDRAIPPSEVRAIFTSCIPLIESRYLV